MDQSGWNIHNSGVDDNISSRIFMAWRDGGQLVAAQADWFRPHDTRKHLDNTKPSGNYWQRFPPKGATVWFYWVSNGLKERTNLVECENKW